MGLLKSGAQPAGVAILRVCSERFEELQKLAVTCRPKFPQLSSSLSRVCILFDRVAVCSRNSLPSLFLQLHPVSNHGQCCSRRLPARRMSFTIARTQPKGLQHRLLCSAMLASAICGAVRGWKQDEVLRRGASCLGFRGHQRSSSLDGEYHSPFHTSPDDQHITLSSSTVQVPCAR